MLACRGGGREVVAAVHCHSYHHRFDGADAGEAPQGFGHRFGRQLKEGLDTRLLGHIVLLAGRRKKDLGPGLWEGGGKEG